MPRDTIPLTETTVTGLRLAHHEACGRATRYRQPAITPLTCCRVLSAAVSTML
jgi:hypothetical protein